MSSCKILYIEVGVGVGGRAVGGVLNEPAGMKRVINSRMSSTTLCGHLTTFIGIHNGICVRRWPVRSSVALRHNNCREPPGV